MLINWLKLKREFCKLMNCKNKFHLFRGIKSGYGMATVLIENPSILVPVTTFMLAYSGVTSLYLLAHYLCLVLLNIAVFTLVK